MQSKVSFVALFLSNDRDQNSSEQIINSAVIKILVVTLMLTLEQPTAVLAPNYRPWVDG